MRILAGVRQRRKLQMAQMGMGDVIRKYQTKLLTLTFDIPIVLLIMANYQLSHSIFSLPAHKSIRLTLNPLSSPYLPKA